MNAWLWEALAVVNEVLWHDAVLYTVLSVGVLFTIWSGFCQYHALTHGVAVIRGKYDDKNDPGAINHFQALSAALSATVGLGNISGVAMAVALGGPGAVFWMWVVGLVGMALKTTEVTLAMLYRDTEDPDDPHGGPMFVVAKGMQRYSPRLKSLGWLIGAVFCITLLIATFTGGNMFQAWSVGEITKNYFDVPEPFTGAVLMVLAGMVILGGIKRIGAVAGRLVPFMCLLYLASGAYVIAAHITEIPALLRLIVHDAFQPSAPAGAFVGSTLGFGLLWGMKRALFSSEAGQGSSPIAHSAAKTDEPVREGVVAGLEPFIDTLVVCTITALVILSSGAWNRGFEAPLENPPELVQVGTNSDGKPLWTLSPFVLPQKTDEAYRIAGDWTTGTERVFVLVEVDEQARETGSTVRRLLGDVTSPRTGEFHATWGTVASTTQPRLLEHGIYADYPGPSLTGHAFDRVQPGLGKWLVVVACWLFALSTIISWSYYGEQGIVFLCGERGVTPYRIIYCLLILVSCGRWINTDAQLGAVSDLGTGVMLAANIPIMLLFGAQAMRAYREYIGRLKAGRLEAHAAPPLADVVEGKDVE